jgi:hypothetical protein
MGSICDKCGSDRPAGLSEEERAALAAFNAGRRAIGGSAWSVESWISGDVTRPEAVAFYRAARAPLEAENKTLREQLGKATETNHRQAKDMRRKDGNQ